jgi:hypothetical protein
MIDSKLRAMVQRAAKEALTRIDGKQPNESDIAQVTSIAIELLQPATRCHKWFRSFCRIVATMSSNSLMLQMWVANLAVAGVLPFSDL